MLTRTVRLQVTAFIVIAVLGVSYIAIHYVGVLRWIGSSGYTVKVDLPTGGGIFSNAEVDYRGVMVGRVGDMRVTATGIQVDLDITSSRSIPKDLTARVLTGSVIGEQYVDLQPRTTKGPYLSDGMTIPQSATSVPPPVQDVLVNVDALAASVPIGSLQTVVNELYTGTQGLGQNLRRLIVSSRSFIQAANTNLPQTIALINSAKTVLNTQQLEAASISSFTTNLKLIGAQLKSSDGDISKVLKDSAPALDQVGGAINQVQGSVRLLLSNLVATSIVFAQNSKGLKTFVSELPVAIGAGNSVITSQGINLGVVPTFFDPLPCTSGYGGTKVRTGLTTSGNPALNTQAGCQASVGSGRDIRGTQNSP